MTLRITLSILAGLLLTLLSTFVGQRWSTATYPGVMGCETACRVAASGWPLIFVRDYTGMSVTNKADMLEVWFAADRFDWAPFGLNVTLWSIACWLTAWLASQPRRPLGD